MHPAIQEWTTNSSLERLRTLVASIDLDRLAPDVNAMVMDQERGRGWTALFNAELQELDQSSAETGEQAVQAAQASQVSTAAAAEPMEVDSVAEGGVHDVDDAARQQAPRRSRLERLRQETAARKAASEPEPDTVVDVVLGSQQWHHEVPRV